MFHGVRFSTTVEMTPCSLGPYGGFDTFLMSERQKVSTTAVDQIFLPPMRLRLEIFESFLLYRKQSLFKVSNVPQFESICNQSTF
jgi:hypothetical protein